MLPYPFKKGVIKLGNGYIEKQKQASKQVSRRGMLVELVEAAG